MRVLPADVYDTLEFSALAFDGIGEGQFWDDNGGDTEPLTPASAPFCIYGHAYCAHRDNRGGEVTEALFGVNITPSTSDAVVRSIASREGRTYHGYRASFTDWCAELGVVRGE